MTSKTNAARLGPGAGLFGLASLVLVAACGEARSVSGGVPADQAAAVLCSRCHGSAENAAPPTSSRGLTDTTSVAVGAHQTHVRGRRLSRPASCAECHVVPTRPDAPGHADGRADVRFGPLATGEGPSPAWDPAAARCSGTYCHGALLPGGSNTTPSWTQVDGTQAACGTCHGAPPPAPHPQNASCGRCHGGYRSASVDLEKHVNGALEVDALSCTSCHGDPDRNAAPPADTQGNTDTTAVGVGAHQAHVQDGALRRALACGECHVVPSSTAHSNSSVELSFGALASTGGLSPAFAEPSATCASTYCHGASLPGGSIAAPQWTRVDGTQAACGTCHGVPPAQSTGHPYAPEDASACARCHPETVTPEGAIDVAGERHIDGSVEVQLSCTSCHGDPSRLPAAIAAAPPSGTSGETDSSVRAVGAHLSHLRDGPIRLALACSDCHVVPTATDHANGAVGIAFGTLARRDGANPQWNGATCSGVYCHGAKLGGGSNRQPQWTIVDGTQAACGTCHGLPPHGGNYSITQCYWCHGQTMNSDGRIKVQGGRHIDGSVQASGGG